MQTINNHIWFNLEPFLDMNSFADLEDKVIYNIAKNSESIKCSTTSRNTLLDQTNNSFREQRLLNVHNYPEFNDSQLDWITQLTSVGLGYHLMLTGIKNYPEGYHFKHTKNGVIDLHTKNDFSFLFDWIENQNIFTEYGRATFWIAKSNEKTAMHSDYANTKSLKKDQFIWLTGKSAKKLMFYDDEKNEIHYSTSRAGIFNNANWHCGLGNEFTMSWSFRVDGIFTDDFLDKTGLYTYFKN